VKEFRRLLAQAWLYRLRFAVACLAMVGFGATSVLATHSRPIRPAVFDSYREG